MHYVTETLITTAQQQQQRLQLQQQQQRQLQMQQMQQQQQQQPGLNNQQQQQLTQLLMQQVWELHELHAEFYLCALNIFTNTSFEQKFVEVNQSFCWSNMCLCRFMNITYVLVANIFQYK